MSKFYEEILEKGTATTPEMRRYASKEEQFSEIAHFNELVVREEIVSIASLGLKFEEGYYGNEDYIFTLAGNPFNLVLHSRGGVSRFVKGVV